MKTGIELITEEHQKKSGEREHDDEELARAAACYASPDSIFKHRHNTFDKFVGVWPWDEPFAKHKHSRIEQLAIAGALIADEIDRLQG